MGESWAEKEPKPDLPNGIGVEVKSSSSKSIPHDMVEVRQSMDTKYKQHERTWDRNLIKYRTHCRAAGQEIYNDVILYSPFSSGRNAYPAQGGWLSGMATQMDHKSRSP